MWRFSWGTTGDKDAMIVKGRGEFQLAILIETHAPGRI